MMFLNDSPAGTVAEGAPIIPISAQLKYNIEVVCEYIVKKIPVPLRDFTSEPRLIGERTHTHINDFKDVCSLIYCVHYSQIVVCSETFKLTFHFLRFSHQIF